MSDEVAILIPAMRPHLIRALCQNIETVTPEPHHVYVMTDRPAVAEQIADMNVTVWMDELRSWGLRLNDMYERTVEPFMFLGADDVWFSNGWLAPAMHEVQRVHGVVVVHDGMNPSGTLALVSRDYIDEATGTMDQSGAIIHPGYRHAYSETELFETAMHRGRYAQCLQSYVEHRHFLVGKSPVDEVYEMGAESYGRDADLYATRKHLWGR